MNRRTIVAGIILSVCHLVLALVFIMGSYGSGLKEFDDPEYVPTPNERAVEGIVDHVTSVLVQPVSVLWTPWMSKNMPDAVEWLLFLGNSLLWGFGLVLIVQLVRFGKRRLSDNPSVQRMRGVRKTNSMTDRETGAAPGGGDGHR